VAASIVDCDPESVVIGLPVEVRFEPQAENDGVYVPVFAPQTNGHG
jgi:uncharacterized OB-fold protein